MVEEWLSLCGCSPRVSSSHEIGILQAAVAGIPRLAQAIAAIPAEDRAIALTAVERSYLQTAKDLGGVDKFAQDWVSAVIFQLRAEIEQRVLENKLFKALRDELQRGDSADPQGFRELSGERIRRIRSRSQVEVIKATRELRFSIRAGKIPMFGLIPFPAKRLPDRTVADEKRSPAPSKKGRKRIEGQREMLLLIPGKQAKEATSETIAGTGIRQKESA